MDISLMPLYIYKIPKYCSDVYLTPNLMYSVQDILIEEQNAASEDNLQDPAGLDTERSSYQSISVIATNTTELRIGDDSVGFFFIF